MTNYTHLTDDEINKLVSDIHGNDGMTRNYCGKWERAGELLEEMKAIIQWYDPSNEWVCATTIEGNFSDKNPRRAIAEAYLHYKSP